MKSKPNLLLAFFIILCASCSSATAGLARQATPTAPPENWTGGGPREGQKGGAVRSLAVDPHTPTTVYAGMDAHSMEMAASLYKSTDGGKTWFPSNKGMPITDVWSLAVDPKNPGVLYAGTFSNGIYKSQNGGRDWVKSSQGMDGWAVHAIVFDPQNSTTLFVGANKGVYRSTNAGTSWLLLHAGPVFDVKALAIDPARPGTLYAGNGNGVYKSSDGGRTWKESNQGLTLTDVETLAIDPRSPSTIYAGTDSEGVQGVPGNIFKSTDGGMSWVALRIGPTRDYFWSLAIDPANSKAIYAGTDGGVLRSADGGETWSTTNTGLTLTDYTTMAIAPGKPHILYAGSYGAGVFALYLPGAAESAPPPIPIGKVLDTGLYVLLTVQLVNLISMYLRLLKFRRAGVDPNTVHLTGKETFRLSLFLSCFFVYGIVWLAYKTVTGVINPLLGGLLILVALVIMRRPFKLVRGNRPVHARRIVDLHIPPRASSALGADFILQVLGEPAVLEAIRADLHRTRLLGSGEQFRLGLLTPETDIYDFTFSQRSRSELMSRIADTTLRMNMAGRIPLKRTAILHPTGGVPGVQDRLLVEHGARPPLIRQYPGWLYHLQTKVPAEPCTEIRALQMEIDRPGVHGRSANLVSFLREDGFPLKASYPDADPLTMERGGTIVLDKGQLKIIYPDYFVQSRLIDDEGNLVYMGIDENACLSVNWDGTPAVPSMAKALYSCVRYNGYVPVLRYRSFPYVSQYMLPILDSPFSDSGWADLFIDPHGDGRLFIARQNTLDGWFEMMNKLRQLFYDELARNGYHLLPLTKSYSQLSSYFTRKQAILEEYFTILPWRLG